MPTTPLFPLPEALDITSSSERPEEVLLRGTSARPTSKGPCSATPSPAIHSSYRRKPLALPCAGRPLRLLLTVKQFFCRVSDCPRKIFVERLPDLIAVSSRLTLPLRTAVQEVSLATCGKGGERLAGKLGMALSDATLLWSLYLLPLSEVRQVEVLGIDDWSYRRGKRYGSILVELQTHKIIALLPDHTVDSVVTWLEAHPQVGIVSRDRGGVSVDGARQGAPLATQVGDRWHLLKNLGEPVEAFLIRAHIRLPDPATTAGTPEGAEAVSRAPPCPRPLTTYWATPAQQGKTQTRLLRKWKLYERIHEWHAGGMSLRKIGEELAVARGTVRKSFRQAPEPAVPTPRPLRARKRDPYEDYMLARLAQGCLNAAQLHREITQRGFSGGRSNLKGSLAPLRPSTAKGATPLTGSQRGQALSPRSVRWLLMRERKDLDEEEQAQLDRLLAVSRGAERERSAAHVSFAATRAKHQPFRSWMEPASKSGLAELKSFVAGVERDYDAVKEALRQPWSQEPTEGQGNKLKTLKRMMYGRAGFRLLRQRLLLDA